MLPPLLFSVHLTDSKKLDSCIEGGLNLISKNNNNNSNNNRNRTTSSNYINNNELPADDIDPSINIKSERIIRSSSRTEAETEKLDEQEKSGGEESQESATENEGDNNNNEDEEREEGEICEDQDTSKINAEKSKLYKKKKRRRRKREMTLKSDQSQQIDDDDDDMPTIKESPIDDDGNLSDSYISKKHSVSITRRRHSSSSDPVNLSIGNKQQSQQEDSDEANIDVETISNAPTKVSCPEYIFESFFILNGQQFKNFLKLT